MLENSVDAEPVKIDVGSSVELRVPNTKLPEATLPNNKRRAAKIINKNQALNDKLMSKQKKIEAENIDVEKSDNESETCLGKR